MYSESQTHSIHLRKRMNGKISNETVLTDGVGIPQWDV